MKHIVILLTIFICTSLYAQVGVNTIIPEGALDINSTNNGVLIPRVALSGNNDITTIVNPQGGALATSTMVYNTTAVVGANAIAEGFVYWDGMFWTEVGAAPIADNLGNHTATTTLDLATNVIDNVTTLITTPVTSYDKLRVWNNANYTIGMNDAMTYGYLNDFAMTFSMNNDADSGWIWRDVGDAKSDGAMSLTTDGRMTLKNNLNVDTNTFFVDATNDRIGIGTDTPGDKLHVVGDILLTGGVRNIEIQAGDQNIQLDDANPVWNGFSYGGVTRFFGDGTLASSKLEAGGLQLERNIQIRGGNPAVGRVLTSDATGNATWEIPNDGDITAVVAGNGLIGGAGVGSATINAVAENGLTTNADNIRLGGTLLENTTITNETFGLTINLNNTGDFSVQDYGINHFSILDNGTSLFGGDVEWRDENTSGTILAQLLDDGDDGRLRLMENGLTSIDLDANSQSVFNEQGLDRNFRVESDANANMFFLDAGLNRVGIGTGSPTQDFHVNGGTRVSGGLTVGDQATPGIKQVVVASTTPDVVVGNTTFNQAESGSIVFEENVASFINSTNYCGFKMFYEGLADNFILQSACTATLDILTIERTSGDIGIKTGTPTASLSVNGTANKTGGGAWAVFSDKRLKKDVSKYNEGLDLIMKVNPVNFSYNERYTSLFGGGTEITDKVYQGVIAQELQKIAPDMVRVVNKAKNNSSEADGGTPTSQVGEYLEVDPSKFTYALINAVQEQQKEIEELKKMVQQLIDSKK